MSIFSFFDFLCFHSVSLSDCFVRWLDVCVCGLNLFSWFVCLRIGYFIAFSVLMRFYFCWLCVLVNYLCLRFKLFYFRLFPVLLRFISIYCFDSFLLLICFVSWVFVLVYCFDLFVALFFVFWLIIVWLLL